MTKLRLLCCVLAATAASCSLDLDLPSNPLRGGISGAIDTQGHLPPGDNAVAFIRTDSQGKADAVTDADGGFAIADLPPGLYSMQVDLPGFAPMREGPFRIESGAATDLGTFHPVWLSQTPSEALLLGTVIVSGGGTGLLDGGTLQETDAGLRTSEAQGATVTLLLERTTGLPVKVDEVTVSAQGTFSSRLPPGRYTIEVSHPYYISAKRTGVELLAGEQKDVSEQPLVLELNPAEINGVVTLETDQSAATRVSAGVSVISDTGRIAVTDAAGHYRLTGLAAGTRTLTFQFDGYHDSQARTVKLAPAETRTIDEVKLLLDRGDITGLVEMSDGSPLDQVTVDIPSVQLDGGSAPAYAATVSPSASTPSQGRFVISGVPLGTYNVRARRSNYIAAQSPTVTVVANTSVDVGTLRLARIQGDFVIDDGDPLNTPGYTRQPDVTLVLSNVMNAAEYRVAESVSGLATATYLPFASLRIPFTLSAGDELKTVYLQIKNTMGTESAPLSSSVVFDTQAPLTPSVLITGGAGFTRIANPLPVTLSAVDTGSGVAWVRLIALEPDGGVTFSDGGLVIDGGSPELIAPRVPYVRDTTVTRPTSVDGVQDVVAQFIDNAGNASAPVSARIVIDTVAPTGSLTITRGARATIDGFTNALLVDLAETPGGVEPEGGYLTIQLANDAAELTTAVQQPVKAHASWFLDAQGEGTKTVHYVFVDAAGNRSGAGSATIVYDATPPNVSTTLLSSLITNDPTVSIQLSTVEVNPTSPTAGLSLSESPLFTNAVVGPYPSNDIATFQVSATDGPKTVFVKVKDAAGNEGTASVTMTYDTTPPQNIGISLAGALGDGTPSTTLTSSPTVTVNLAFSGATRLLLAGPGLTSCPALSASYLAITGNSVVDWPLPSGTVDGGTALTRAVVACFADEAGNTAGPVSAQIEFDATPPTGCGLVLEGRRVDGTATTGPTAGKSAARTVGFTVQSCTEQPVEIAVTEATTVSCASNAQGLVWAPYVIAANELTLSSIDGLKTVRGCVRDAARNATAFTAGALTLDTTPPTNTSVAINAKAPYANAAQVDAGITVAGLAVGADEWAIAEEGSTPTVFQSYLTQNPQTFVFSALDGVKTIKAIFRDDVGNVSTEVADSIEIDTAPPTLASLSLLGTLADGTTSSTLTSTANITATLSSSGATTVFFGNASLSTCPATGHSTLSGTTSSVTLTGTGVTRTVKACVGDPAGNVSGLISATIDLDSTPPTGCAVVLTGRRADGTGDTTAPDDDKTGNRTVRFALSGCSPLTDVADIFLTESPTSCSPTANVTWLSFDSGASNTVTLSGIDGLKTVRGCVRDGARNTLSLVAGTITLDTTPPTAGSVTIDSSAEYINRARWLTLNGNTAAYIAPVTGSATGATEWAIAETATPTAFVALTASPINFTFTAADGRKTIRALFRDGVGNVTTLEAQDSIEFDTVLPILSSVAVTGTLADGTASTSLTATTSITASVVQSGATGISTGDATLACGSTTYSAYSGGTVAGTLGGTGTTRTFAVCVTDAAGNTAGPVTDLIDFDNLAPTGCSMVMAGKRADGTAATAALDKTALRDVTFDLSGCSTTPADVYTTEAATVTCTATAALDWRAFNGATTLVTLSSADGAKTVRGCVRDAARNVSSFVADALTLDTAAPTGTVLLKAGATYFNRADYLAATPASTNTIAVTASGTPADLTDWALAETTAPSSFVAFSSPRNFTFTAGDATKTVRTLFRDNVGNVSVVEATDAIDVDTTPPVLTSFTLSGTLADGTTSATTTTSTTVIGTFTVTGAAGVLLVDSAVGTCPATGYTSLSGTTASVTLPGSGTTRNAKACAIDAAGNTVGPTATTVTMSVDATSPTGCALVLVGKRTSGVDTGGATAQKTALTGVTATLATCTETPVDIFLTESASVTCSATSSLPWAPLVAGQSPFTLSDGDATKTVRGCVRDAAHNVASLTSDDITLDTTPPSTASVLLDSGASYVNAATVASRGGQKANVTGTATGATEWAIAESATPSSFTAFTSPTTVLTDFSGGDGTKEVFALFRDDVGNTTPIALSDTIAFDTVAPSLTSISLSGTLADGTPSESATFTTTVTLTSVQSGATGLYVGDGTLSSCPTSGYVSYGGSATPITITSTGIVRVCVSDAAGNTAGYAQDTITVDGTAPGSCALALVGRKVNGTATSGATVNKTAQTQVGVSLGSCTETPSEIYVTEATSVTCTATATFDWVAYNANTAMILTSGDATKTVRGCVRDAARNVQSFTLDAIDLDTTPPTAASVSLHGGAAYFNRADSVANTPDSNTMNAVGTATGAAEWALAEGATPTTFIAFSSPATNAFPISSGEGTKTIRVLFRDDVGNVTPVESQDSIEVDTVLPTLSSIVITGALADGTPSTSITQTTAVTLTVDQTGASRILIGDSSLTSACTGTYVDFNGATAATTISGAGQVIVRACVRDLAGNTAGYAEKGIVVDSTAPTSCALTLVGRRVDGSSTAATAPEKTAKLTVSASLSSCSESVADIYLLETTGALSCPAAGSSLWQSLSGNTAINFDVSTVDALKTVKACVRDSARNVSASSFVDTITLDTTAPTAASVVIDSDATYINRARYITLGADYSAPVRGVATGATEWAIAEVTAPSSYVSFTSPATQSFTFTTSDGTKTIRALFRDDVGNFTAIESTDSIVFDTQLPAIASVTLMGALADGTPSSTVTATTSVTATITQSGASKVYVGDATVVTCPAFGISYSDLNVASTVAATLAGSGTPRTITVCVADAAGNLASATPTSASIAFDSAAPSGCLLQLIGVRADGVTDTSGATSEKTALRTVKARMTGCLETPVDVGLTESSSFDCSTGSGITWVPLGTIGTTTFAATFTLSDGDVTKTVRGCVRDVVRNPVAFTVDTITLDTASPTNTSVLIKSGDSYFNKADFMANTPDSNAMDVTGTATGATEWAMSETGTPASFVSFTSPATSSFTFSIGDGSKEIRTLFRDDVGNTTVSIVTDTIQVDTVDPDATVAPVALSVQRVSLSADIGYTNTESLQVDVVPPSGASLVRLAQAASSTDCVPNDFTNSSWQAIVTTYGMLLSGVDETKRLCAQWQDAAGNTSTLSAATELYATNIVLDRVAPTTPQVVDDDRAAPLADGAAVTVTIASASSDTNLKGYEQLGGTVSVWTSVTPTGLVFPFNVRNDLSETGFRNQLRVRAVDRAGNASGEGSVVVTADTNAPGEGVGDRVAHLDEWVDNGNARSTIYWKVGSSEPSDVVGYKIYYGSTQYFADSDTASFAAEGVSPITVGKVTSTSLSGLPNGAPTWVRIRPYDKAGNVATSAFWSTLGTTNAPHALEPNEVSPNQLATVTLPSPANRVHRILNVDNYLYVAAGEPSCTNSRVYLHAIDMKELMSPIARGAIQSTPNPPVVMSTQFFGDSDVVNCESTNEQFIDMQVEPPWLFMSGRGIIRIFNIANPGTPVAWATIDVRVDVAAHRINSIAVYGDKLVVSGKSGSLRGFVSVYSLAKLYDNDSATRPATTITTPSVVTDLLADVQLNVSISADTSTSLFTHDKVIQQSGSGSYRVVDLAGTLDAGTAPVYLGSGAGLLTVRTRPPVSGSVVYETGQSSGFTRFDISSAWAGGTTVSVVTPSSFFGMGQIGHHADLAVLPEIISSGLRIIDLRDSTSPRDVGYNAFGTGSITAYSWGNYTVVATLDGVLRFFELATPRAMSSSNSAVAHGMFPSVNGRFLYMGADVFDLQQGNVPIETSAVPGASAPYRQCSMGASYWEDYEVMQVGNGFRVRTLENGTDGNSSTTLPVGTLVSLVGTTRVTDVEVYGNYIIAAEIRTTPTNSVWLEVFDAKKVRNRSGATMSSTDSIASVQVSSTVPFSPVANNIADISVNAGRVAVGLDEVTSTVAANSVSGNFLYFVDLRAVLDDDGTTTGGVVHGPITSVSQPIAQVRQVQIQGNYAYAATSLGLRVVSVAEAMDNDPATMMPTDGGVSIAAALFCQTTGSQCGSVGGNSLDGVTVTGSNVFVTPGPSLSPQPFTPGVYVINVATPLSPLVQGSYPQSGQVISCTIEGDTTRRMRSRIAVGGSHAYFSAPAASSGMPSGALRVIELE